MPMGRVHTARLWAVVVVGMLILAPMGSVVSAEPHLGVAGNDSNPATIQSGTANGTISLNRSSVPVTAGESFGVAVTYDATTGSDATRVYGAEFDLNYNTSFITVTSIEPGPYFDQDGTGTQVFQETIDTQTGTVEYAATSRQATNGVGGRGDLLYLRVQVNQSAPTAAASQQNLTFSEVKISDPGENAVDTTAVASTVTLNIRPRSSISVPSTPVVDEPVTIAARNASDPDGSINAYEWDFDGDQDFADGTGPSVNTTFTTTGSRPISLRITDNDGATRNITRTIDVQPANVAPTPNISIVSGDQIVNEPLTLTAAESTDTDGTIVEYNWDLDDDAVFDDATGQSANVTFDTVGKRAVSVRIEDDDGATAKTTKTFDIARQTIPLNLTANTTRVSVGSTVRFKTSRSDTSKRVNATVTAGSATPVTTGADGEVSLSFDTPGETRVRASKPDTEDTSFQNDSVTIVVEGPEPRAAFSFQPLTPEAGETIAFDASNSSVLNGTIVRYSWDLDGDGQFGDQTGAQVTSTFNSSGNTTVSLLVEDDSGKIDTTETDLQIRAPGTGIELRPAEAEVAVNESRQFDIVATDLNDGVGAFIINVSVDAQSTAEIADATQNISSSGGLSDIQISTDNSVATFDVATLGRPGFNATDEFVIGTVRMTGQSVGSSDINISVTQIGDKTGSEYALRFVKGANLSVTPQGPPTVGSFDSRPKDPDNDGTYENVNGDGFTNVLDVVALFSARDGSVVSNNTAAFDFNDDGRANVLDVVALFQEVTS